jgi:hypothetical protein
MVADVRSGPDMMDDVFSTRRTLNSPGEPGEQDTGELVWASPMWITYTGK